ncbi:MAG TPA: BPSS1780 family membrane protein [Usitatibacter sp.]|nr:BPSS1780 family membrane protein [Usitatibacter sp.]
MDPTIRVAELGAGRGPAWLAESFRLFRGAPLQWIALCAGWLAISLGLLLVPFLGLVVSNLLQPVFFASFAIAAYRQASGERLVMRDLFRGFRRNMRALVNLGALLLLAQLVILMLMAALGMPMVEEGDHILTVEEYVELLQGKEWILGIGLGLTVLVKGALWFAPPLIAFHGMSTTHAVRWSVYAAFANLGAMLAYGAVLLVLFVAGMLPWALGLVVVLPLAAISTYVGYHEVFEATPAPDATPP